MVPTQPDEKPMRGPRTPRSNAMNLALGFIFGIAFGFLLQKGGVAKFHILIGVLLLEDFTVIQVMLSAIIVGMIGLFFMQRAGMVELHPKPTRYAANIIGGLLFGVGFAMAAYCPGTSAAALGQGNWDALAVMVGMMAGSFIFAQASAWLDRTITPRGDRGKLLLPDLLHISRPLFIAGFSLLLVLALLLTEYFG